MYMYMYVLHVHQKAQFGIYHYPMPYLSATKAGKHPEYELGEYLLQFTNYVLSS